MQFTYGVEVVALFILHLEAGMNPVLKDGNITGRAMILVGNDLGPIIVLDCRKI